MRNVILKGGLSRVKARWYQALIGHSANYIAIITLISSANVFFSNATITTNIVIFLWAQVSSGLLILCWSITKNKPVAALYLRPLALYFHVFYAIEPVFLVLPRLWPLNEIYGDQYVLWADHLIGPLMYCITSIFGFMIALILFNKAKTKLNSKHESPNVSINWMLLSIVCIFGLIIKLIVNKVLMWGLPGTPPINTIPILTGVSVMFSRYGLIVLLSSYSLLAFIKSKKIGHRLTSLCLLLGYLVIDIFNGSKYSLMFLSIISIYIVYQFAVSKRRKSTKLPLLALSGVGALLSLYPYINYLRFARIRGGHEGVGAMVSFATDNIGEASVIADILGRIGSFASYVGSIDFVKHLNARLMDLLSSKSLTADFTEAATGISNAANAYGMTQPLFLASLSGWNIPILFLSSLFFGLVILYLGYFISVRNMRNYELQKLSSLIMSIFIVHVYFGGGNLIFFTKEMVIIGLCFMLIDRYVLVQSKNHEK